MCALLRHACVRHPSVDFPLTEHARAVVMVSVDDEWFGTLDAAACIGITHRARYRLVEAGFVVANTMRLVIRTRSADLDAFLDAARGKPGDPTHLPPETLTERPVSRRRRTCARPPRRYRSPSLGTTRSGVQATDEACPYGGGERFADCHGVAGRKR